MGRVSVRDDGGDDDDVDGMRRILMSLTLCAWLLERSSSRVVHVMNGMMMRTSLCNE